MISLRDASVWEPGQGDLITLPEGKRSMIPDAPLDRSSPLDSLMQGSTLGTGILCAVVAKTLKTDRLLDYETHSAVEAYLLTLEISWLAKSFGLQISQRC